MKKGIVKRIKGDCKLVDLLPQWGIKLTPSGKTHRAVCPFHSDRVPSLTIYPETNSFFCFGCNVGGDVITFVRMIRRCDFPTALRELAEEAGLTVPQWTAEDEERALAIRRVREILTAAALHYHRALKEEHRIYLRERGLADETIDQFKIGVATLEANDQVLAQLKEAGYTDEEICSTGLSAFKQGGLQAFFHDRLVFPYFIGGLVVYFIGRALNDDQKPKYVKLPVHSEANSHISPAITNKHFFNEDAARGAEKLIITEGLFDCILAHQAGFRCIAPAATQLSGAQRDRLMNLCRSVKALYICFDSEMNESGMKAALGLLELLEEKGKDSRLVILPRPEGVEKVDLADFLVGNGPEAFEQLLSEAPTVLEYDILALDPNIAERDRIPAVREILARVAQKSHLGQDYLLRLINERLDITLGVLRKELEALAPKDEQDAGGGDSEPIEGDIHLVHPAQDYYENAGHLAIPLYVRRGGRIRTEAVLITSDRRQLVAPDIGVLEDRGVVLKRPPEFIDPSPRWTASHRKRFLGGEEVAPVDVFEAVRATYEKYIEFHECLAAETIALWTLCTYLYRIFEAFPYIALVGTKGSGKTKTINVAARLCFNALASANITLPGVFRIIEMTASTLLLDEAERLARGPHGEDLRLLLNAGYKRGTPAIRVHKDTFMPEAYEVYGPKIIANIKGLEEVLADRSIEFVMLRSTDVDKANRVVSDRSEDWAELRHRLYSFALTHFPTVRSHYDALMEGTDLVGREGELWNPILALAKTLEEAGLDYHFSQVLDFALEKEKARRDEGLSEWSVACILALASLVTEKTEGMTPRQIAEEMVKHLDLSEEEKRPRPAWVGKELKRLGLGEKKRKARKGMEYMLSQSDVDELLNRYRIGEDQDA